MEEPYDWSVDEAFIAELDNRMERFKNGTDHAYTMDEVRASLSNLKKDRKAE